MSELVRASVRLARFASSASRKILEFHVVRREPRCGTILFLARGMYYSRAQREREGEVVCGGERNRKTKRHGEKRSEKCARPRRFTDERKKSSREKLQVLRVVRFRYLGARLARIGRWTKIYRAIVAVRFENEFSGRIVMVSVEKHAETL